MDLIKNNDFENPYYLIKSFGSVYRLASDLKFIACVGDENEVNIYDKITEKNYKTSKAHEAGCINLAFQKEKSNEESKFFCSTSADGYLNVFSLEKNDDKYDIRSVKNIKISKEISSLEQVLKPNW